MNSHCTPGFWKLYRALSLHNRQAADNAFELWSNDPTHPSLYFKPIHERPGEWSARVSKSHRAVCIKVEDGFLWYGIGDHEWFDKL